MTQAWTPHPDGGASTRRNVTTADSTTRRPSERKCHAVTRDRCSRSPPRSSAKCSAGFAQKWLVADGSPTPDESTSQADLQVPYARRDRPFDFRQPRRGGVTGQVRGVCIMRPWDHQGQPTLHVGESRRTRRVAENRRGALAFDEGGRVGAQVRPGRRPKAGVGFADVG